MFGEDAADIDALYPCEDASSPGDVENQYPGGCENGPGKEVAIQTDGAEVDLDNMYLRKEIRELKARTDHISVELFRDNPSLLKFYTGLTLVTPSLKKMPNGKLTTFEMVAMFFF